MLRSIEMTHEGMTMRGMEHVPETEGGQKVPACIILHGFTGHKLGSHRMYWKIGTQLEQLGIATFRFDFLGSGESDGHHEDMTISKEVAQAGAILDRVKNDPRIDANRILLLGHSMGGLIASMLAGDRPDEIQKLALLCPAGNMYQMMREQVEAGLAMNLPHLDWDGNLIGREFALDLRTIDGFGRAQHYNGDVLLIHGSKDPLVPVEVSGMYKERCYGDRATVHVIEGADHSFNKYEWEQELIRTFLNFAKTVV